VKFNVWFKTKSWQSVVAADVNAAIKRAIKRTGEERRINLIDCEATVDHMLLNIGARDGGHLNRMKHLVTGASARVTLRAAPDIRFDAGISNFWQMRHGTQPGAPDSLGTSRRGAPKGTEGDA
jgi:REP element-mobilizing transposase RayT